jgi:hypothetical protein
VLAVEQEDHRETRESVNAFNAQIQVFMAVIFSGIYMCFTFFTLQAVGQRISDTCDIHVPTWQASSSRSRPISQWSPWPSSGSSAAQVSYNLTKLNQT